MPPSSTSTFVLIVRLFVTRSTAPGGALRHAGRLLFDLQYHRVAFVDLRRDLQDLAHFLALNRLEWIDVAVVARITGVGVLARDERHFLRDLDFGFLVVESHDRRCLQNVRR